MNTQTKKVNGKKVNNKKQVKQQVKKVVKAVQPKKQVAAEVQAPLKALEENKRMTVATRNQLRLAVKRERAMAKGLNPKTATSKRINQLTKARVWIEELRSKFTELKKERNTLVVDLRKARQSVTRGSQEDKGRNTCSQDCTSGKSKA